MIYECQGGHVSFSKDYLNECGMRGCNKSTVMISPIDIKWFYKISKKGLSIDRKNLHKIIEDPNMPREVKKEKQRFSNICNTSTLIFCKVYFLYYIIQMVWIGSLPFIIDNTFDLN